MTTIPPRREADDVEKPNIICDYNDNMGGVDRLDQVIANYDMQRKSQKWWKKVFVRMIELCVVNAFVLFLHKNPQHKKKNSVHKAFCETLAIQLTQSLLDKKADTYKSPLAHYKTDDRLVGKHFPTKHSDRGRCTVCAFKKSVSGKRKDTKTKNFCKKCEKFICLNMF
jgi:hypothetical protein